MSISTESRPTPSPAPTSSSSTTTTSSRCRWRCACASEGLHAQRHAARSRDGILTAVATIVPGVVLLDLDLGRGPDGELIDGTTLVAHLCRIGWRVIVLSATTDEPRIGQALDAGALACVLEDGGAAGADHRDPSGHAGHGGDAARAAPVLHRAVPPTSRSRPASWSACSPASPTGSAPSWTGSRAAGGRSRSPRSSGCRWRRRGPRSGPCCTSSEVNGQLEAVAHAERAPAGDRGGVTRCYSAVRILGPSAVTAIVCSAWAARLPSAVRRVQPSASW